MRFDLIVSNPPYIARDDAHLTQGDLRFEPRTALSSGQSGMEAIEHIVAHARDHLRPEGWLILEHGYDQAPEVREQLELSGFGKVTSLKDIADIPRVTLGCAAP